MLACFGTVLTPSSSKRLDSLLSVVVDIICSMLVGAPKSESRNHADSSRRGAVYSCSIMKNEPCEYKELEEQLNVGKLMYLCLVLRLASYTNFTLCLVSLFVRQLAL